MLPQAVKLFGGQRETRGEERRDILTESQKFLVVNIQGCGATRLARQGWWGRHGGLRVEKTRYLKRESVGGSWWE